MYIQNEYNGSEELALRHSNLKYWAVQWSWFAQVNALCNLSCKKSQKITAATSRPISEYALVHVEYNGGSWTENAETLQMPLLLCLQKLQGKGDGGWGKKCLCVVFCLTRRKLVSSCKKMHFLASLSMGNKLLLVARHILTTGLQKWIHCHRLPLWRKYALEVKVAKGLKRCWVKVKGVNNPAWTAQ